MQITDIEREKPEQNNKITNPIPNVIPALNFFFYRHTNDNIEMIIMECK